MLPSVMCGQRNLSPGVVVMMDLVHDNGDPQAVHIDLRPGRPQVSNSVSKYDCMNLPLQRLPPRHD